MVVIYIAVTARHYGRRDRSQNTEFVTPSGLRQYPPRTHTTRVRASTYAHMHDRHACMDKHIHMHTHARHSLTHLHTHTHTHTRTHTPSPREGLGRWSRPQRARPDTTQSSLTHTHTHTINVIRLLCEEGSGIMCER